MVKTVSPCPYCGATRASYWRNDSDPGDSGTYRDCGHYIIGEVL